MTPRPSSKLLALLLRLPNLWQDPQTKKQVPFGTCFYFNILLIYKEATVGTWRMTITTLPMIRSALGLSTMIGL